MWGTVILIVAMFGLPALITLVCLYVLDGQRDQPVAPLRKMDSSLYLPWLEKQCAGVSGRCATMYQDALMRDRAFIQCVSRCEDNRACRVACLSQ
jgi:hypothetical protein